ncbi:MAG: hypothetical protein QF926_02645 [Alphaproteobacteria bacterium]|nr:hypothetical protein [Alphaproteobacteria bacterium]MDP6515509.1 hypothetical protein [Alphaproteobacteria bacterium]
MAQHRGSEMSLLWFIVIGVVGVIGLVLASRAADATLYWSGLALAGLCVLLGFRFIIFLQDRAWTED